MEILSVSLKGAYDSVAQQRKIISLLRKKKLLNPEYLYRGIKIKNLEATKKSGIDRANDGFFFACDLNDLLGEVSYDSDRSSQNAIAFAIDEGALSVYSRVGFERTTANEFRFLHADMKPYLLAIVLLEF